MVNKKLAPMYNNQARALTVQKHQLRQATVQLGEIQSNITSINQDIENSTAELDNLFNQLKKN